MASHLPLFRAAALAGSLLLAAACSDDDDDDGGPADETLRVVASMGAQDQTVVLINDGAVEGGATVLVNGTAATEAPAGTYSVALAAPVAAGGALDLDITSGTAVIEGTGTVPGAAVITAPADGADVASGGEVGITWTAAVDPGRWVVDATGPTVQTFDVPAASDRAFTIPAGALADGDWVIRVRAHNDGGFTGDTEAGSAMAIVADPAAAPTVTLAPLLLIRGADMGPEFNHVFLSLGGVQVDGATVTVNGEAATQTGPGTTR